MVTESFFYEREFNALYYFFKLLDTVLENNYLCFQNHLFYCTPSMIMYHLISLIYSC